MRTSSLLFSIPLLLGVLAAQGENVSSSAVSGGDGKSLPATRSLIGAGLTAINGLTTSTSTAQPAASSPAGTSGETDCCPKRTKVATVTAPVIPAVSGELTKLQIRGKVRTVEIMTDQYHVRGRDGKGRVVKIDSKRSFAGVEQEASLHETATGERADLVAYLPGRPRTDASKMLITKLVTVRLASGVTPSVFAKSTGAVRAQRPGFAPDALILTYHTASEAMAATTQLRAKPGVLDAEVMIATKHVPHFMPTDQFFSPVGPEYAPFPNSDNVDSWICQPFFCDIRGTHAYQWWANNLVDAVNPCPLNMLFKSRVDLGDYMPIQYDPALPGVHGEQADLRLPVAWENPGKFGGNVSGQGIFVLIIDDGIKKIHPDLSQAVDQIAAHNLNLMVTPNNNSPDPVDAEFDSHGTSLAGIVGARLSSVAGGKGMAGVAPKCILQSAVAVKDFLTDFDWAQAFAVGSALVDSDGDNVFLDEDRTLGTMKLDVCLNASAESAQGDAIDLIGESWLWKRAIRFGATRGRITNGIVYITSAGNGGSGHNDTNYSELKNCIYQIPVGSCSELGRRIAYSNPGANLVCVAPSWGDELPPLLNWNARPVHTDGTLTTFGNRPLKVNPPLGPDDLPFDWRRATQGVPTIKSFKANTAPSPTDLGALYDFNFGGTSASAGMVAGVVALMLENRGDLSARDVKEILLRSCRVNNDVRVTWDGKINPTLWRMSRTGRPMSPFFGAGLIDANKAIKISADWPKLPVDPIPPIKKDVEAANFNSGIATRNTETGGLYFPILSGVLIPTNPANGGPGHPIEIILPNPPSGMRIETLEVRVRFYHKRRGDLEIKLVAPASVGWEAGREMESVLYTPHRDDYTESRWDQNEPALRDPTDWTFTTVRHWGTRVPPNSSGQWKVVITDMVSKDRTTPKETVPPTPTSPPQNILSVDDPVFCPIDNPRDGNTQRMEGVGITYHGTFAQTEGNDPPTVTTSKIRVSPSTDLTKIKLLASGLGKKLDGDLFPITNWDFFDTTDIVPLQPSNEPREYLEYYPPAMALDPTKPDDLTPYDPPPDPADPLPPDFWPNQPLPPLWVPWMLPPPPVSGPMGGLISQPPWAIESPDHTFLVLRDPNNVDDNTNFIYIRLNRRTGEVGMIPANAGRFSISVFAENLVGMSQPKKLDITVAPPTYESWIAVYYPGADPSITDFTADPDGDGIQNGLEYAMRLDPTIPDEPLPTVSQEGNEMVFTYQEDTLATAPASLASFGAEVTTDLETWSVIEPTVLEENNFLRKLEVRFPVGDDRTFVRLRAVK